MGYQRRSVETIMNMARMSVTKHRAAITITDAAEVEIIISSGYHAIEIQNFGGSDIYYGASGVASTNGVALFSGDKKILTNVEETFSIYFVVGAGETSEIRIAEFK